MTDPATPSATPKMLTLTAQIVVAHVGANKVPAADVPALINNVYGALLHADAPRTLAQQPAVPINRSIQREYLVCLENGAKLKLMKRYLQAQFGLTPDAYRAKWGLPRNYPMVAPAFAAQRSALAKQLGLGTASIMVKKEKSAAAEMPVAPVSATVPVDPGGKHTVASVFANFPGGSERPVVAQTAIDRAGRPRGTQQTGQTGRKRSSTLP